MISSLKPLFTTGELDSVHILIKEEEKVVERHVFDFQLSLNHDHKPKNKRSMESAFIEFLQGDRGLADLSSYYSAVTQHLIRLVQVGRKMYNRN